jgi:hypothetical protein
VASRSPLPTQSRRSRDAFPLPRGRRATQGSFEPFPGSRYSFVYSESQWPGSSFPSFYRLVRTPAFVARVSRLGAGFQLLRDTLFVFGTWSWPAFRYEQVYRGQDSRLCVYRPAIEGQASYGPVLLSKLMAEGYAVYDLSDF